MAIQLILQFALIGINAFFACAEIALIQVNETKLELLESEGNKRAKMILSLTRQPARFLATIQVGITLAGFLGSAFAANNFSDELVLWFSSLNLPISQASLKTISVVVITLALSFITLALGELVPKRIAMKKAESIAFFMTPVIYFISWIFSPIVWLLTKTTNALLRMLRINPEAEKEAVTEEEIRMLVDEGSRKGSIDTEEKDIIHNVFEFSNTEAAEVMTHRTNLNLLMIQDSDKEWEQRILEYRHHFYPVCGKTPDDVIGILNAQDYFRLEDRSRNNVMEKAVREAYFIPESVKTDVLFRRMQRNRNHFAVVVDEYGGLSGVITMNDLLEQLVGDLDNDADSPPERPLIEKLEGGAWRIQGVTPLEKVEKTLNVDIPDENYGTFGGFVFDFLGEIPDDGWTGELVAAGLVIKIEEIHEHRLETALVFKNVPPDPNPEE